MTYQITKLGTTEPHKGRDHVVAWWLRHYDKSRKVVGSKPDEVNEFFSTYLIFLAALGPEVYSASNRNEYQKQKNNVSGE
jgi:hypothetical protein